MATESELQYTSEHEWVLVEGTTATIGITAYAAEKLGDVVYVDLPDVGTELVNGSIVGEIESTKSVGELFAPVDGTVLEKNAAVEETPELVNSDPLGDGWLIKVQFTELPALLSFDEYAALLGSKQAMSLPFTARHIGTDAPAQAVMLSRLGYDSVDGLVRAAIPGSIQLSETHRAEAIPAAATERETIAELRALANANTVNRSMIGLGYYDTITPAVIRRNVLENPSWYTAYTPYQPEISQGRLEALINFQTMVADLTGLSTANASMLDEATAVVEGMLLARRASKSTSNVFLVDADALPQTKSLLRSRAEAVGIEIVELTLDRVDHPASHEHTLATGFGAFIQYPVHPAGYGTRAT